MLKIVSIILIIVSVCLIIQSLRAIKNTHKVNEEIDRINKIKEERTKDLNEEISIKEQEVEKIKNLLYNIKKEKNDKEFYYNQQIEFLNDSIEDKQKQLDNLQQNVTKSIDTQKQLSQSAFQNYCEVLIKSYDEKEKEYQDSLSLLQNSYSQEQLKIIKELEEAREENKKQLEQEKEMIAQELAEERKILDKVRETRASAVQAQLKEKEISEKLSFYCLQVTDNELKDIAVLESIKPKLHNSRILSMLIQQTYWRTPMTKLCNNIIGSTVKTGIYKITNQKTKECYIGQAVDLASRWKDHAKAGLGIDTPVGNKLYKAMQEFGINNFSQEVLEFCSKEQLDEKEKYYINLYYAKDFGYNTTKGNGKGDEK